MLTAMSWDFVVPVSLDDLVKSGAINQYVVQEVLSVKQLPSYLNGVYTQHELLTKRSCFLAACYTFNAFVLLTAF